MQLFALDSSNILISASEATKHRDYRCLECSKEVRRRGGSHRQDHFYHLKPDPSCRQSQKSAAHLQLQQAIACQLPPGEGVLERRFPEIARIADVAWEARRLIFEVQCSPITAAEVQQRNADYARIGYQVIWILHERQYNRVKASAAEIFLDKQPHYYTNMDGEGRGLIFDQLQIIHRGSRRYKKRGHPVKLSQPKFKGSLYFEGDYTDRLDAGEPEALADVGAMEQARSALYPARKGFLSLLYKGYVNCFHLIVEKYSMN